MNSIIIEQLNKENKELNRDKPSGWANISKSNQNLINIISSSGLKISNTDDVISVLRQGGMKLNGEKGPHYKAKCLLKIDKIIKTCGNKNIPSFSCIISDSDSDSGYRSGCGCCGCGWC